MIPAGPLETQNRITEKQKTGQLSAQAEDLHHFNKWLSNLFLIVPVSLLKQKKTHAVYQVETHTGRNTLQGF